MTQQQKRVLIVAVIVHVILMLVTRMDLHSRPDDTVRGSKRMWRTWSTVNTTGSLAYWFFGRKPGGDHGVTVEILPE
jgi:hypothetical protein